MTHPPHLPAPSCSLRARDTRRLVFVIVIAAVFGLVGGAVAGLTAIDRLYPVLGPASTFSFYTTKKTMGQVGSPGTVDASVIREWHERTVRVYDESKILSGGLYPQSAALGDAVILNAGGWTVLHATKFDVAQTQLSGIDWQGKRYTVAALLHDREHNLVYLKFNDASFRATTSFADPADIVSGHTVWALGPEWQQLTIGQLRAVDAPPYHAARASFQYDLGTSVNSGSIIVTDRGDMVGFAGANGLLIPGWFVSDQVSSILSNEFFSLATVDWQGVMIDGVRDGGTWQAQPGFLITKSKQLGQKNSVGRGDILLKIAGVPITLEHLAEQISAAPKDFAVTVLRAGKEVELVAHKEIVTS